MASSKKATAARPFVSFVPPTHPDVEEARSNLMPICANDRENYSEILLSLSQTLSRLLASALGIGNHHVYFRPLWDPKEWVHIQGEEERRQFVGFEYFGINRHIPHLVDISTLTFLIEFEVRDEAKEWCLDFTNPNGESLVLSSANAKAYSLLLNDVHVSYGDLPVLYHAIRHREYAWRFFEATGTSGWDIMKFLTDRSNHNLANSRLYQICSQLGLLRDGKLTVSGESLLGRCSRKRKYEYIRIR